ncbi:MAG: ANTAR domain-containing protein [Gammaproteobacteria bacterium]|nr:ANTAR domain-containing protein [Gammaproteobacteria bacterium]
MSSRLNVLIIASDDARASVLQQGATECPGARVEKIRDTRALLRRLATLEPDVVLIDLGSAEPGALEEAFAASRAVRWPIAVFVDAANSDTVQAAIEAGVAAFVVDGFAASRIKPVIDVAMTRFRAMCRLRAEASEARLALEERKLIERGKAILMKQNGLDEDQAYQLLRRSAMRQNRKMADLARSLIAASQLIEESKS